MIINVLKLFWIFFQIGLFTFGGGYAMIPLIEEMVVQKYQFINLELFTDMIAISESSPGPFAVNMATFIGIKVAGPLGAVFATLGVVLPSFIIILIIASIGKKFLNKKMVQAAFLGIRPAAVGLVIVAFFNIFANVIIPNVSLKSFSFVNLINNFEYISLIIILIVFALSRIFKKLHPIFLIIISGILGLLFYGIPLVLS